MGWPDCTVCGQPVMCGQGKAHYSCLGMCQGCFKAPAAHPYTDRCDRCQCDDQDEDGETYTPEDVEAFHAGVRRIADAMERHGAANVGELFDKLRAEREGAA
jgi:hypothetical protein